MFKVALTTLAISPKLNYRNTRCDNGKTSKSIGDTKYCNTLSRY